MPTHKLFLPPLLLTLVLACAPWLLNDYYLALANKILIYAIFALSLQLLVGGAGLVSLGQAAFFGIAAYATVLFSPEYEAANLFFVLPAALVCAGLYAALTGALVLRTTGIYFIMVTLAFCQMVYYVFHDTSLGGGSDGIYLYIRPEFRLGDLYTLSLDSATHFYLYSLALLALSWLFLSFLMRSTFGAALTGIRLNEQRMRAHGFHTFQYKWVAYIVAGIIAALAGNLYAMRDGYVNPELLAWEQSGLVLLMVILGGKGRLWGAIAGAVALTLLQELFQSNAIMGSWANHWHLSFGLSIIVLVALLPNGLVGLATRRMNLATAPSVKEER